MTFVVARTIIKKSAPACGADAKLIWFSTIVKAEIGSCITPLNDTNNVYGFTAKNGKNTKIDDW